MVKSSKLHWSFIWRQINGAKKQIGILLLCIALSIMSLVALGGLQDSVDDSLSSNARELHGADIIVHDHAPFSAAMHTGIDALVAQDDVERARYYEFLSIARSSNNKSVLANIKVVEELYPFYGSVVLQSGNTFSVPQGEVIVEELLLLKLNRTIGDLISIGEATFRIRDVVISESDKPLDLFSLGPRIFISAQDKDALQLFKNGSRVEYVTLLKLRDADKLELYAKELEDIAVEERVETYKTANSGIKRFLDNFLFFLRLLSTFTLLLAGLGIHSTLSAFIRARTHTVAIMKTVGANTKFILSQFLVLVLCVGTLGTLLGLVFGLLLQLFLPQILSDVLPDIVHVGISWSSIFQSTLLGMVVVLLFAFLPLYSLRELRPIAIMQQHEFAPTSRKAYVLICLLIALFFAGFIFFLLRDFIIGLYFILGMCAVLGIAFVFVHFVLVLLQKVRFRSLVVTQAITGLFRPHNATKVILITLAASLAVLFSIVLLEQNIDANYVQTYPEGSPNLFFIDIQAPQVASLASFLPEDAVFYPIVSGKITSINDKPVDIDREKGRNSDNLAREFSLTYRDELLPDEKILTGKSLFGTQKIPVSIHKNVLELSPMRIGDTIAFTIQGVPIVATVSSIRDSGDTTFTPFFYFVFPTAVLEKAPQTIFTAVYTNDSGQLQNEISNAFPTVTAIDVRAVIGTVAQTVRTLSRIITFFASFALIAGVLIIISSLFATQHARTQEAVYFKVLGATKRFVQKVFLLESILIGLISAIIGVLMAHIGSYILIRFVFDIPYVPFIVASTLLILGTVTLVALVGWISSLTVLRKKPARFLQEHTEE